MYYDKDQYEAGFKKLSETRFGDDYACLVFVAEASRDIVPQIRSALGTAGVNYAGGIFPSIIANGSAQTTGFVATIVPVMLPPLTLSLSAIDKSDNRIQKLNHILKSSPHQPLMMVFSSNSMEQLSDQNRLAHLLQDAFPSRVAYIGGCAGSATLDRTSSIFDNNGVYDDAAVLTVINRPSWASAQIGWTPVGKPNFITHISEDGTIIRSVNNKRAASWFTDQYKQLRQQELSEQDISFASNLQIGFFSYTGGYIVRAVLGVTPDGGLIIGGTIPHSTAIRLMDTNPKQATNQIQQMADDLRKKAGEVDTTFIVECVTRPIILGDVFSTELQSIEKIISDNQLSGAVGFVALGEFGAVEGASHADLLNVSIVLAVSDKLSQ